MTKDNCSTLIALTTAAMLLPGLSKHAEANPIEQKMTFDYKYSKYSEGEVPKDVLGSGSADRYDISINQFKFKSPLSEDTEVSISGVQETMSGASPWYIVPDENGKAVQIMSGATIDESRSELSADFRSYNKNSESTLSAGYSKENDYRSLSLGYSGSFRFNQNLSTIDYGVNTSRDYLEPSDTEKYPTRPDSENKSRMGAVIGFSQVATKNTLIGGALSYSVLDGYLSDPYKFAYVVDAPVQDNRPDTHTQLAQTLMVRQFVPALNAAVHLDYRHFSSNWGMDSNTVEFAWYQNVPGGFQIIPSVRYYQQTEADFYQLYYTELRKDGYYSSDYRLSDFSANSAELKVVKTFDGFSVNASYQTYEASGKSPSLVSYTFFSLGVSATF